MEWIKRTSTAVVAEAVGALFGREAVSGWTGGDTLAFLDPIAGPSLWTGLSVGAILTIILATGWFVTRFLPRFLAITKEQKFRSAALAFAESSAYSQEHKRSIFYRRLRQLGIDLPTPAQVQDGDATAVESALVSIAVTSRRPLKEARRVASLLRQGQA